MTIKAVLRNGRIEPLERLPAKWADGQELIIELAAVARVEPPVDQWAMDLEAAARRAPAAERDRFSHALDEILRNSKSAFRR